MRGLIVEHLADHYEFYGAELGVRIARKHLGWYTAALPGGADFRRRINATETVEAQLATVGAYFDALLELGDVPARQGAVGARHHGTPTATVAQHAAAATAGKNNESAYRVGEALAA